MLITTDMVYRDSIRHFFKEIHLNDPFAITLTMKNNQFRSHSENFRHFMNRLNQSYLGNAYRKQRKRLTVIPIIEANLLVKPHYHCVIDNPYPERSTLFVDLVRTCWSETLLGQRQIDIQKMENLGWIDYMTKLAKKGNIADSVDWINVHINTK